MPSPEQIAKNHWYRNDDLPGVSGPEREIIG